MHQIKCLVRRRMVVGYDPPVQVNLDLFQVLGHLPVVWSRLSQVE